ncbi:MAG TPA: hypothetical protein VNA26_04515, partial [Chitinophagaceae bacterium]|nr:hypothetical protein [Chitinophagaceae bacterium]
MLKRKQLKAGFFGHGLLIISTPHGAHLPQQPLNIFKSGSLETIIGNKNKLAIRLENDTIILRTKISDSSLASNSEMPEAEAPKISLNPKGVKFVESYLKIND